MEIRQLECFVTCAEAGSISGAAELLYMDQSGVSRMIRNLEQELEIELFIRGRKGVTLTQEGKQVYLRIKTILSSIERLKHINSPPVDASLRIASFQSNCVGFVFSLLCEKYKEIAKDMQLMFLDRKQVLHRMEHRQADIGFIYYTEKHKKQNNNALEKRGLEFHPLCPAYPAIYIGRKNPLHGQKTLTVEQMQELAFFRLESDFEESFADLWQTIRQYRLKEQLRNSMVINNDFTMNHMLNETQYAYLGHVWERYGQRYLPDPMDKKLYSDYILLDSADGDIHFGYLKRSGEALSALAEELLNELQTRFIYDNGKMPAGLVE